MDGAVFDTFVRRVPARWGVAGAAFFFAATGAGAARPGRKGAPTADKAGLGETIPAGGECGRRAGVCAPGSRCVGGICECAAGLANCGGQCVDLASDANSCGRCGFRCRDGQSCKAGFCCGAELATCSETVCEACQVCAPTLDSPKDTCCDLPVFMVRCPAKYIAENPDTGRFYCDTYADATDFEKLCCPDGAVCPRDGVCCIASGAIHPCDPDGRCPVWAEDPPYPKPRMMFRSATSGSGGGGAGRGGDDRGGGGNQTSTGSGDGRGRQSSDPQSRFTAPKR